MIRVLALLLSLLFAANVAAAERSYRADYHVRFLPETKQAEVSLTVTPGSGRVSQMRLNMPEKRYLGITGDGSIERKGARVTWKLLRDQPSTLTWRHNINRRRASGGYDARITDDWAILRGDKLFPAARVRASKGAVGRTTLRFELPPGWTNVDTAWRSSLEDRLFFVVDNPDRAFARPVGWIIAGGVGTRREFLLGTELVVAGPKGSDVRRNDILGFLNAMVPEFQQALGQLPPKILIVSAGNPMWRGGLSGPQSLFLHADRPMISENGSSTLAHELFHVITRIRGAEGDDWIAEGLAEYYSIELLQRAGLLSASRYEKAFGWMRRHGKAVKTLGSARSHGPRTARAVTLLREIDAELRQRSQGRHDLDQVVRALLPLRRISRDDLRSEVEHRIGPSKVLDSPLLQ
ncbi:MAG TPA: hypothetical protein VFY12_06140 [Arenimonas sp.]|nr:hypothetical protein [Arenimonas sp.]